MQNLIKYSNQHHMIMRGILKSSFMHDFRMYRLLNLRCIHSIRSNKPGNSPLLTSCKALKQIHREYCIIRSILQDVMYRQHQLKCNVVRTFRTNSVCLQDGNNKSNKEDDEKEEIEKQMKDSIIFLSKIALIFMVGYLLFILSTYNNLHELVPTISWNEFIYQYLAKGEVKEIAINGANIDRIEVHLYPGAKYKGRELRIPGVFVNVSDINNVEEKVRKVEKDLGIKTEDAVPITNTHNVEFVVNMMIFLSICMLFVMFWNIRQKFPFKFTPFADMKRAKYTMVDSFNKAKNPVRFEDVAGLHEAKVEVMEFVDYLKHPDRYKTLGAKIPKGALLLGPPGCGKTLLAKAIATEADVPFFSMNGSEFIEMLGGIGVARVRDLFEAAKMRAPSIIYIDEIDAIGRKREDGPIEFTNSESERTLNQLLVEMDGMMSRDDVIILASTNRAEVLDKALLRPGRLDRHILIDLPTREERKQIFERHLKTISLNGRPSQYSSYLAYLTPGFSGADIANVCNEAALHAVRVCKKVVDSSDLLYAIDRVIAGSTKITNTTPPATKRIIAYHEAGHALVGWLLEHTNALLKVTIIPRTNALGGFAQYTENDQKLHTKEELFEMMCMMLGGRVAESIIFNSISTGAQNDLQKVTKTAYNQVHQFGMSPIVGLLSFSPEFMTTGSKKPYSKKLHSLMDAEVRRIIAEAYLATERLLSENRDKLEIIAEALLKKETLNYDDVEKLIGPPPYPKKRHLESVEFEFKDF